MTVAVVASFGRLPLLQRLLTSLSGAGGVAGVVLVNNARELIPDDILAAAGGLSVALVQAEKNLGSGGGVARGLELALADARVTDALICDDDAEVLPGAPAELQRILREERAGAVVPMVLRETGEMGWFPGLLEPAKWRVIKRQPLLPEDYLIRCGTAPVRFSWAPWPVMLVAREAVVQVGLPRSDFWYQGVDLEYALRISARFRCYFVPTAVCRHLPPAARERHSSFYHRECLGMQNMFFMGFRLHHCRRALRHVPGNSWRFLRQWHFAPRACLDLLMAAWRGAVRGGPCSGEGFDQFKKRWERSFSS